MENESKNEQKLKQTNNNERLSNLLKKHPRKMPEPNNLTSSALNSVSDLRAAWTAFQFISPRQHRPNTKI